MKGLFTALQLISVAAAAAIDLTPRSVASELETLVGHSTVTLRQRWSEFDAPDPVVVVSAKCESDIQKVVKYCSKNNLKLLPQNGGNGWAALKFKSTGVVLDLAHFNSVTVAADKKTATIGGGAIISEVIAAADKAGVLVMSGNCNCVGALGAGLGGGFGNMIGELGMVADNILSLRVITPDGKAVTVSQASNPDLFWAMRGAGPNFGVVTYATVKATATADRTAWLNSLTFDASRIGEIAQVVNDLPLLPNQNLFFLVVNSGSNTPMIVVNGYLRGGNEESGRKAFAPLYALNPNTQTSSIAPYTAWGAANDGFCAKGGRKPGMTTAIKSMKPEAWVSVAALMDEFLKLPNAGNTAIVVERYNTTKAQANGRGSTAVNDELRFNSFGQAIVLPWYSDASLDATALEFASKVRNLWSDGVDGKQHASYVNFAQGDEDLAAIYGTGLARLQALKKQYDPKNVFGQWFSLA